MPTTTPKLPFRKRLVISGLIEQADLDFQLINLRERLTQRGIEFNGEPSDEQLASWLVEQHVLTRYQANQLLAGHTKLNLGAYVVIDALGQGGMGQVFLARHQILGRLVALKVLPRNKTNEESVASFMHEIRAQAQLDHENLVSAIDAGHDGNVYYLVCEYVPGMDLRRLVREKTMLGMVEATNIITQAAHGLDYAHQCGLIHRDVKPGNLLVTPDGICKVSDLGLAGWLNDDQDPRAGKIVGTADYLSPEQIRTPKEVTSRSDIYSLGCTLYYAVTGKVPYPGGTTREKARRHCEDSPIHPRVLNSQLSEQFVRVLAAMMAKDKSQRIQSMEEVIDRLAAWTGNGENNTAVQTPESPWRDKEESDSGVNVLDGTQDTEPSEIVVDTSLSSSRISRTPPTPQEAWTIPDDPNIVIGGGSQSMPQIVAKEPYSINQWLVPVLLGLVALLAVCLVITVLVASLGR